MSDAGAVDNYIDIFVVIVAMSKHRLPAQSDRIIPDASPSNGHDLIAVEASYTGHIAAGKNITQIIGYSADEVHDLVAMIVAQLDSRNEAKHWNGVVPYPGLEAFQENEASFFFGREVLVASLVKRIDRSRSVYVAGPSGSGKSSLIQAGLLPALKAATLPKSDQWRYATMRPGAAPVDNLAKAIGRLAQQPALATHLRLAAADNTIALDEVAEMILGGDAALRLLLYIDQFEELFTQTQDESERRRFLALVIGAVQQPAGRVTVIFSLRTDFVGRCLEYPGLRELMSQEGELVGAMQADELVRAIALPALSVGVDVEPALIEQVIADMRDQPGALPLMQFAVKTLFEACSSSSGDFVKLTKLDYITLGGVRHALEQHAETVFSGFTQQQTELCRHIFISLTDIDSRGIATRRIARYEDLAIKGQEHVAEFVISALVEARLLTSDADAPAADDKGTGRKVTIAHESLLDAWPWLRNLVKEQKELIALYGQIAEDAQRWSDERGDTSYLYLGARLETVQKQLDDQKGIVPVSAQEFLNTSILENERTHNARRAAREKELEQARALADEQRKRAEDQTAATNRLQIRNRALLGLLVAVVVALGISIWAFRMAQENATAARYENAKLMAAQSQIEVEQNRSDVGLALAIQALTNTQLLGAPIAPEMVMALRNAVANDFPRSIYAAQDEITTIATGEEGTILAVGAKDGRVMVSSNPPADFQPSFIIPEGIEALAFDREGQYIVAGGAQKVTVWSVTEQKQIDSFQLPRRETAVTAIAFLAEESEIAVATSIGSILIHSKNGQMDYVLAGHIGRVTDIHYEPALGLLASAGEDGSVRLWDPKTKREVGRIADFPAGWVYRVRFFQNGVSFKLLAASGGELYVLGLHQDDENDGAWSLGRERTIQAHEQNVKAIAINSSQTCLVTIGQEQMVKVWDIQRTFVQNSLAAPISEFPLAAGEAAAFGSASNPKAFPCGDLLYLTEGNSVLQKNIGASQEVATLTLADGVAVNDLVFFSPDETTHYVVAGDDGGGITFWDFAAEQSMRISNTHIGEVTSVAIDDDLETLLTTGNDGVAKLWRKAGEMEFISYCTTEPAPWRLEDGVFLPKSTGAERDAVQTVAVVGGQTVTLYDAVTCAPIITLPRLSSMATALSVSPDGRWLAVGADKQLALWNLDDIQKPPVLKTETINVQDIAWGSDDGMLIVVGRRLPDTGNAPHIWRIDAAGNLTKDKDAKIPHNSDIYAVEVVDERREQVITGGVESQAIIWRPTDDFITDRLHSNADRVIALDVSEDGKFVATGDDSGVVRIHVLDLDELLNIALDRLGAP